MFTPQYGYNPYYTMPQPMPDNLAQLRQQQYQPQNNNGGIVWVQGEEGAKAYMVGANNSVLLMDSDGSSFYLKSADASGMPSLRIFDYVERTKTNTNAPVCDSTLADRVTAIEQKLAAMTAGNAKEEVKKDA